MGVQVGFTVVLPSSPFYNFFASLRVCSPPAVRARHNQPQLRVQLPVHPASRSNPMAKQQDKHSRTVLPIPDGLRRADQVRRQRPGGEVPAHRAAAPAGGAPDVLVILLDDAGFGSSSAFGGPCYTPTCRTARPGGLKYNRFHTTALCRPPARRCAPGATTTPSAWVLSRSWLPSPGYNATAPEYLRAAAGNAEAQRL